MSWGSILPSAVYVEARDHASQYCPLLFPIGIRYLPLLLVDRVHATYTHGLWEVVDHSSCKMHEKCLIIIHDPNMRQTEPAIEPGTFGVAAERSTTEPTLPLKVNSSHLKTVLLYSFLPSSDPSCGKDVTDTHVTVLCI